MGIEEYQVVRLVGKGSFGKVYLVKHRAERKEYCLKVIKLTGIPDAEREACQREVSLLQQMLHPNIVGFRDAFVARNGRELCIVMTFCDGGDLEERIRKQGRKPFKEAQIWHWFVQMTLGLQYMHDRHVLHRDLKTQNVFLLGNGRLVLGDLGISKVLTNKNDFARTAIGTPYYMSPELFKSKPYNHKSDIWALGCIAYELTMRQHAFDAGSLNGLAAKITQGKYTPIPSTYSRELRGLVDSMLSLDPGARPSLPQVLKLPVVKRHVYYFMRDILARPTSKISDGTMVFRAAAMRVGSADGIGGGTSRLKKKGQEPLMAMQAQSLTDQLESLQLHDVVHKAIRHNDAEEGGGRRSRQPSDARDLPPERVINSFASPARRVPVSSARVNSSPGPEGGNVNDARQPSASRKPPSVVRHRGINGDARSKGGGGGGGRDGRVADGDYQYRQRSKAAGGGGFNAPAAVDAVKYQRESKARGVDAERRKAKRLARERRDALVRENERRAAVERALQRLQHEREQRLQDRMARAEQKKLQAQQKEQLRHKVNQERRESVQRRARELAAAKQSGTESTGGGGGGGEGEDMGVVGRNAEGAAAQQADIRNSKDRRLSRSEQAAQDERADEQRKVRELGKWADEWRDREVHDDSPFRRPVAPPTAPPAPSSGNVQSSRRPVETPPGEYPSSHPTPGVIARAKSFPYNDGKGDNIEAMDLRSFHSASFDDSVASDDNDDDADSKSKNTVSTRAESKQRRGDDVVQATAEQRRESAPSDKNKNNPPLSGYHMRKQQDVDTHQEAWRQACQDRARELDSAVRRGKAQFMPSPELVAALPIAATATAYDDAKFGYGKRQLENGCGIGNADDLQDQDEDIVELDMQPVESDDDIDDRELELQGELAAAETRCQELKWTLREAKSTTHQQKKKKNKNAAERTPGVVKSCSDKSDKDIREDVYKNSNESDDGGDEDNDDDGEDVNNYSDENDDDDDEFGDSSRGSSGDEQYDEEFGGESVNNFTLNLSLVAEAADALAAEEGEASGTGENSLTSPIGIMFDQDDVDKNNNLHAGAIGRGGGAGFGIGTTETETVPTARANGDVAGGGGLRGRMRLLKEDCEKSLGSQRFEQVYKLLRRSLEVKLSNTDDTDLPDHGSEHELEAQLRGLLAHDGSMAYWQKVDNLIFMQETEGL